MTLIYVTDNDCAIGRGNSLLCRLPLDMKRFRELTTGGTVIMGRRTWESFPKRPLPNRENIVLSRRCTELDGARVFPDIENVLEYVRDMERVFVIGGAEIYRQMLPYCDEALVTRVYENFGGDVFLEDIGKNPEWELAETSSVLETECRRIRFFRYTRRK
ncbi:MAG: dihydrofolate reductase [Oscillospiraceae bacterium]|nr:dihydrofolate reductase [Oscillospiraceae bacterium]